MRQVAIVSGQYQLLVGLDHQQGPLEVDESSDGLRKSLCVQLVLTQVLFVVVLC